MRSKSFVVSELRDLIRNNHYAPQSQLPAERLLAEQFQVSRSTLRLALATLEAEGELWRQVGHGTFIGKRPSTSSGTFSLPADLTNPSEVMEVRLIIEPQISDLAAHRATAADIKFMRQCLAKGSAARDTATFEMWDGALHRAVAEAARNTLLLALFNAVNAVRDHAIWGKLKEDTLTDQRRKRYTVQHANIVHAIERRDAVEARSLTREHLEAVRDDMLDRHR
ncbi:MAG: FadR family transcriptional regulator [Rhodospirillales bacterium]|nr:FadR family transcriptional regulator [Rhodospirillales bacterium]